MSTYAADPVFSAARRAASASNAAENAAANAAVKASKAAPRDPTKEWRPDNEIGYAPLFLLDTYSHGPAHALRLYTGYFFGNPGYFYPWNIIYYAVATLVYTYARPTTKQCTTLAAPWIAQVFVVNLALLWVFAGGWHCLLYQLKVNGIDKKYDPKWQAENNKKFLFGDQVYDNVFMSCASGVTIWTLYEVAFMHMVAAGKITTVSKDWWASPVYNGLLLVAIPFWREFHFYWIHRFSHWKPLYKSVHYLHHKNVNPGPWSGLAMHPVEHLMYFSVVIPHMFVPCHPIHFFFNAQHTALTPAGGHHGFDGPVNDPVGGKDTVVTGSYFHYLHHRYFECNYGEATIPLDKWFGSFRDGKSVGTGISSKGGGSKEAEWVTASTILVGTLCSFVPLVPFVLTTLK